MNKCREAFEQKFPIPAHWIEFDEKHNKYYCPYVADAKAFEYQEMWKVWQSRQAEINQLKHEKSLQELEINQVTQANQVWQSLIEEKDKRITELEKSEFELAKVKQILNKRIKTRLLESIIVRELIDLLFSDKERGNNANS